MTCLHPNCGMGKGLPDWASVLNDPAAKIKQKDRPDILAALASCGPLGKLGVIPQGVAKLASFARLMELAPCLYSQVDRKVTARGVVHLCEVTLGTPIVSSNAVDAFEIQHPRSGSRPFRFSPVTKGAGAGDITEALCGEVLTNHLVPAMKVDPKGWPLWASSAHVSLNSGKMSPLKLYGDFLIPAAPHNLLVSVKTETARERLVVSGNRLESVGFGFFNDAREFWSPLRMNLFKRWGFIAIYMPSKTAVAIRQRLKTKDQEAHAFNLNGRPLYRSIEEFGNDMARVAGKLTMGL